MWSGSSMVRMLLRGLCGSTSSPSGGPASAMPDLQNRNFGGLTRYQTMIGKPIAPGAIQ